MSRSRLVRLLLTAVFSLIVRRTAWAYTVDVEPPDRSDQVLTESFSRLCGELAMYGLDVHPAATAGSDAIGGVSLVRHAGQPSANIWVAAPSTTERIVRITITAADAEPPTLLAIRAADVLRASLRDFRGLILPLSPPAAAEVSGQRPTAAVGSRAWPWSLTASATSLFDPATLGFGLAPSVEVSRHLSERLFVVLEVTGPSVGHTVMSNVASARVREAIATAALAVRVGEGPRAGLDLFLALGPAYVAVHGDAMTPWAAEDSSAWVAASAVGARLAVHLTRRWSMIASAAALVLVPRPVIDVGPGSYALGQMLLLSSLGLDLAL